MGKSKCGVRRREGRWGNELVCVGGGEKVGGEMN